MAWMTLLFRQCLSNLKLATDTVRYNTSDTISRVDQFDFWEGETDALSPGRPEDAIDTHTNIHTYIHTMYTA